MSSMEKVLILLMAAFVLGLGYMAYDILDDEVTNAPGQTLPPKKITADDSPPTDGGDPTRWTSSTQRSAAHRAVEVPDVDPDGISGQQRAPIAGTGTITGVVMSSDAKPLFGATIEVLEGSNTLIPIPAARRPTGIETRSDARGRFVLRNVVPARNYVVVVSHPDFSNAETGPVAVEPDQPTFVGKIFLRQGLAVFGTVTDETERPVPGARVSLSDQYASAFMKPEERKAWKSTLTDEKGRYRFENLHFNSFQIAVFADGYGTQVRNNAAFMRRAKDSEMDFELTPASRIAGWLTSSSGTPVAEAEISATLINSKYSSRGTTTTDDAGRFVINGLVDGFYMMHFDKHGYTGELLQRVRTGTDQLRVTLLPNGVVEGRVVDAKTSAPVTEFIITVKKFREGRPAHNTGIIRREQSADGSFRIDDLDPENYTFFVTAKGYAVAQSDPIQVRREQTNRGITIGMDRGGAVKGRLIDSSGKPITGAMVKVNPNNFRSNPLVELFGGMKDDPSRPERSTVTGPDGRFQIDMVLPDSYQLAVEHPAFSSKTINDIPVARGEVHDAGDIRLSNGGVVAGKVTDTGGKALAGATINASTKTGFMRSTRSNEDGTFRIDNLPPGKYHVSIQDWIADNDKPLHPLERLVRAKDSSAQVYVEDGRTAQVDLHLGGRPSR